MYLFLNVYILVRIFKELFFVSSFLFFENYGCLLSRTTVNRSNHAIRFMLVFSSSKKTNPNRAEQCMAVKRLFHAVAQQQQTNHAPRSCRTRGESRAAFCSRSKVNPFPGGCCPDIPPPAHRITIQFASGSRRADEPRMRGGSTVRRLAFGEGTVAVWVAEDAQWSCQAG